MKNIARKILKFSAKVAVWRNGYKVVAITGSAGKTSARKAISLVMEEKYSVLSPKEEGYNTEIGVPMALIQKTVPKNKLGWFILILMSPILALKKRGYEYCVLEMGADKPGDIEYLTSFIKPDVAVVTNVFGVHLEEFKNIEEIAKEKARILSALGKGGIAVVNLDNEYTKDMHIPQGVEKTGFGKASNEVMILGQDLTESGTVNKLRVQGSDVSIKSSSVGEHLLYTFAAAVSVGVSQGIPIQNVVSALESYQPPRSRLNIIKGEKDSIVIDDSYNANPASMKNAIDALEKMGAILHSRKIAVLGSMNELGKYEEEEHKKIGNYLYGKCDILVVVGEAAEKYLAQAVISAGMEKEKVFSFTDSASAGEYLQKIIRKGDIVLFKGSQNKIRLEKAVKMIMKNPEDAQRLLCRQKKEWGGKDS